MEAVASPSRTNELFFVADGTGGHTFSENYDQHRRAVGRWREIERDRRDADQIDRIDEADEVLEREGALPRDDSTATVAEASSAAMPEAFSRVRDPGRIGRSVDASEGTALDPLGYSGFDLNAPQVVPVLEPLPGEEGAGDISDARAWDPRNLMILPPPRPSDL